MRRLRRVLPVALLLGLLSQGSVDASPSALMQRVRELNFVFTPQRALIELDGSIAWTNETSTHHTATSDAPLSLWDSGPMRFRDRFEFAFTAAGSYTYNCIYHEGYGMVGTVVIPDRASPPSGPVGTVFTIEVATVDAPADYVYDIQKQNPGDRFRAWMMNVTTTSVPFDSTGQPTGTYGFRSRLRRVSDGAGSLYSSPATITVTP